MKKLLASAAMIALLVSGTASMAQDAAPAVDPGHPRVNEVDQRLNDQQQRIDNGVNAGQVGAKQEMRDDKTDARVSQEMSKDEAKNGGHITKGEQRRMNRQLNKNSTRIHRQRANGALRNANKAATPAQ